MGSDHFWGLFGSSICLACSHALLALGHTEVGVGEVAGACGRDLVRGTAEGRPTSIGVVCIVRHTPRLLKAEGIACRHCILVRCRKVKVPPVLGLELLDSVGDIVLLVRFAAVLLSVGDDEDHDLLEWKGPGVGGFGGVVEAQANAVIQCRHSSRGNILLCDVGLFCQRSIADFCVLVVKGSHNEVCGGAAGRVGLALLINKSVTATDYFGSHALH